jgi:hypothetical protein
LDALGELVIPEHGGRLHSFVRDRVVLLDKRSRRLVVKILSLSPSPFDAPWPAG